MRKRNKAGMRAILCRCGGFARQGQRLCNECHAAYQRAHRKKHSELPEEQRRKAIARGKLHVRVSRGKIIKGVCSVCGTDQKIEAHHPDYSKPYDVIWLCRKHHIEHHEKSKEVAPTFVLIGDKVVRVKPDSIPPLNGAIATVAK